MPKPECSNAETRISGETEKAKQLRSLMSDTIFQQLHPSTCALKCSQLLPHSWPNPKNSLSQVKWFKLNTYFKTIPRLDSGKGWRINSTTVLWFQIQLNDLVLVKLKHHSVCNTKLALYSLVLCIAIFFTACISSNRSAKEQPHLEAHTALSPTPLQRPLAFFFHIVIKNWEDIACQ